MIVDVWRDLPKRFPLVETDEFVVMPNHIHGIISLDCRGEPCVRPMIPSGEQDGERDKRIASKLGEHKVRPYSPTPPAPSSYGTLNGSLSRIIQAFKSLTTLQYAKGINSRGWKVFSGKLWQRNYYEHVIRNGTELNLIREYIINNPMQWELDRENPDTQGTVSGEPWEKKKPDCF